MGSYEMMQDYMEQFHNNPVGTTLWTAGIILIIAAIAVYGKWRENKSNRNRRL